MRYATAESVKEAVALDSLCAHLGIMLGDDGRALCPFHDDHDPSFYLWDGTDGPRWWCMVCGFGGDAIDLMRRHRNLSFAGAVAELDLISGDLPPTGIRFTRRRDPAAEAAELSRVVGDAMDRAALPEMDGYMSLYAIGYVEERDSAERFAWDAYLRGLGWGVDDLGRVVMPHWDSECRLTGAKLRSPTGERSSVPGSSYRDMYMSWKPARHPSVIVCEGETDAAYAGYHARDVDVLGLPSGASSFRPEWAWCTNRWKTVLLAFDGDRAGALASQRWVDELGGGRHGDVRVCHIPEGHDLRSSPLSFDDTVRTATPA